MTAVTRLGTSGTPAKPYGSFTKNPAPPSLRSYTSTFTRLIPGGTPSKPYGSFSGKAAASIAPTPSISSIPVLTFGQVTDVDIDLTYPVLVAGLAMSSNASQGVVASMSIIPVATQGRSGTVSSGTFPRTADISVIPVLALAVTMQKDMTAAYSAVADLEMLSTVDTTSVPIDTTPAIDIYPLLAMASSVLAGVDVKTSSADVIPVLTMTINLAKIVGNVAWSIPLTATPETEMESKVKTSGEVDHIHITAAPIGRIRITKV